MKRTAGQNKTFWALVRRLGLDEESRRMLIYEVSGGRTESSRELSKEEMQDLIRTLQGEVDRLEEQKRSEAQRKRKIIFKIFYDLGWIDAGMSNGEKLKLINAWIKQHSGIDKDLNALSIEELNKVIKQLNIVKGNYEKKKVKRVEIIFSRSESGINTALSGPYWIIEGYGTVVLN